MTDWSEGPNVREEVRDAVAWGKKIQRERIIALLEACECGAEDDEACLCEYRPITRWAAIALIKGDN